MDRRPQLPVPPLCQCIMLALLVALSGISARSVRGSDHADRRPSIAPIRYLPGASYGGTTFVPSRPTPPSIQPVGKPRSTVSNPVEEFQESESPKFDFASTQSPVLELQVDAEVGAEVGGGDNLFTAHESIDTICRCAECSAANGQFYASAEMLIWWSSGFEAPALVTTSPVGAPANEIGILGKLNTTILYGKEAINDDHQLGGRFVLGKRQPCGGPLGWEARFTFLEEASSFFQATSASTPIIARPFFNVTSGLQDAVQIAIPGELQGSVSVHAASDFDTVELLLTRQLSPHLDREFVFGYGYRYAELSDRLQIDDSITALVGFPPLAPVIPIGTNLSGRDFFGTKNRFHGGQLGLQYGVLNCRWSLDMSMSVALGNTDSTVSIDGSTVISIPGGGTTTEAGSKLALPSNIGTYRRSHFSVIPELNVRLNRELSCGWRASIGYSLLYWSHVARAGDQIDVRLDENQFPLPNLPAGAGSSPQFQFDFDDYLVQGLRVGIERRY